MEFKNYFCSAFLVLYFSLLVNGNYDTEIEESVSETKSVIILKNTIVNEHLSVEKKFGACLKEGTLILMSDKTQKPIELLKIGDFILDHNLEPTRVIGVLKKFLLEENFYGFRNESFFFTETHILVGPNQEQTSIISNEDRIQLFVQNIDTFIEKNPLMNYLNVKQFPQTNKFSILSYDPSVEGKDKAFVQKVLLFKDPQKADTFVYILSVESPEGTYFANGFVCRHEIPPMKHWPNTMSLLFSLFNLPEIKMIETLPYSIQTLQGIERILEISLNQLKDSLDQSNLLAEVSHEIENSLISFDYFQTKNIIRKIFDSPTFSAFSVGLYGKLGPLLADNLDNPLFGANQFPIEIAKLKSYLFQHLRFNIIKLVQNEL